MKVLVIEDRRDRTAVLLGALAEHEVCVDKDAAEGLTRALQAWWDQQPYDVVICELAMPGLGAFDVGRALCAHACPPELVIIASPGQIAEAHLSGDRVLAAPFTIGNVEQVIASIRNDRARKVTRPMRALCRASR